MNTIPAARTASKSEAYAVANNFMTGFFIICNFKFYARLCWPGQKASKQFLAYIFQHYAL